jgi:hypothetical protein
METLLLLFFSLENTSRRPWGEYEPMRFGGKYLSKEEN